MTAPLDKIRSIGYMQETENIAISKRVAYTE